MLSRRVATPTLRSSLVSLNGQPLWWRTACARRHRSRSSRKALAGHPDLKKAVLEAAAKVTLTGNADLPFADGVGLVERRQQFDGRSIVTVYPKTAFRKRKLKLLNLGLDPLDPTNPWNNEAVYGQASEARFIEQGLKGITEECVRGHQYYFEDGLRKVRPYYFVHDTVLQQRTPTDADSPTVTLFQTLKRMLPFTNRPYLRYLVDAGLITVNMQPTSPDQVVVPGDYLAHLKHVHETPTLDLPIEILHDDDEMLVVNKPPSFLTYPMASQKCNTLTHWLKVEHGYDDLRPVHRLDKPTSGVCIFAKGPVSAMRLAELFRKGRVSKEYLALVDGEFPEGETTCDVAITEKHVLTPYNKKPFAEPKESRTVFHRMDFDGRCSLVRCLPVTGRTHQIRIHLKQLGFHIVNDNLYNPRDEALLMSMVDNNQFDVAVDRMRAQNLHQPITEQPVEHSHFENPDWLDRVSRQHSKSPHCLVCHMGDFFRDEFQFQDRMFMCLHAWKYRLDGRYFETEMPAWVTNTKLVNKIFERRKREEGQKEKAGLEMLEK